MRKMAMPTLKTVVSRPIDLKYRVELVKQNIMTIKTTKIKNNTNPIDYLKTIKKKSIKKHY